MQADNLLHLQFGDNPGDANDLYYADNRAADYQGGLSDDTTPAARWWDGTASGLRMENIGSAQLVMSAKFGGKGRAPQVTQQPTGCEILDGTALSLGAQAQGTTPLRFQWRRSGANVAGATSLSYNVAKASAAHSGDYTLVVTNAYGAATSQVAHVVVRPRFNVRAWYHLGEAGSLSNGLPADASTNRCHFTTGRWAGSSTNNPGVGTVGSPSYTSSKATALFGTNCVWGSGATVPANNGGFEAWVKPADLTNFGYIVTLYPPILITGQVGFRADTGYFKACANGAWIGSPVPINTNAWTHLALVCDNGMTTFYVNGQPAGDPYPTTWDSGMELQVAGQKDGTRGYRGLLDEVRLFDFLAGQFNVNDLLRTNMAPLLLVQPQSQTLKGGSSATLSVTANGSPTLAYQWRHCGTNLPGARSSSYSLAATTTSHRGPYDVVVTNNWGAITSAVATLTLNFAPSITRNLTNVWLYECETLDLAVGASGDPPLYYQWRQNGTNVPGAGLPRFWKWAAAASDAGTYSVVITNSFGSLTSKTAVATVYLGGGVTPRFLGPIYDVTTTPGQTLRLTATGTGYPEPSYQWYLNGVPLAGATTTTYTKGGIGLADEGTYSLVASNVWDTATVSATVSLLREYGCAPWPYPTAQTNGGAVHLVDGFYTLGYNLITGTDARSDGLGDDGVRFEQSLRVGRTNAAVVFAPNGGRLTAWIDFQVAQRWSDAGDLICSNLELVAGTNRIGFVVPTNAVVIQNGLTWARFRLTPAGSTTLVGYAGQVTGGEVEDYPLTIGPGTIPAPVITNIARVTPSVVQILAQSTTGSRYRLLKATNLGPASLWWPIYTNQAFGNATFFLDHGATNPRGFYRVQSLP